MKLWSNKLIEISKMNIEKKSNVLKNNKGLRFNTSSFLIKSEEVMRELKKKKLISNKIQNIKCQLRSLLSPNFNTKDNTDDSLLDEFIDKIEIPIERKNNFFKIKLCEKKNKKKEILIEKKLKKKELKSRLIFFKKVSFFLTSVFNGTSLDLKKENLKKSEIDIIIKILKKKYWKYGQIKLLDQISQNLDINDLSKFLKLLQNNYSLKRVEEVNKFLYKNIIKLMKKKFIKENNSNEKNFYDFYFSLISKKKKLPIKSFYDPLNHKQKILSLNNRFLILIFSSKKFYYDFFKILEHDFNEVYKINVFKKFEKLFKKFEIFYKNHNNENFILNKLLAYLKKTKGLKFPWDFRELECAKKSFKGRINLLLHNK